jgi:hypothetical protein
MPSTYTGVAGNVPNTGSAAPTTTQLMVGTDPPTAASAANPIKTVYDYIADWYSRGALINVARSWSAIQTFLVQQVVTPANDYTAARTSATIFTTYTLVDEFLLVTIGGNVYGRFYHQQLGSALGGLVFTVNAKWDAAGAGQLWYADVAAVPATKFTFGTQVASVGTGMGFVQKQSAPASWTDAIALPGWDRNPIGTPLGDIVLNTGFVGANVQARLTADGYVHISGLTITAPGSGAVSAGQIVMTMPAGWRPATSNHYCACITMTVAGGYGFLQANSSGTITYQTGSVTWPASTGLTFADFSYNIND